MSKKSPATFALAKRSDARLSSKREPKRASPCPAPEHSIAFKDGRKLGFAEFGAKAGFPVIALHGTPGSHLDYASVHEEAAKLGLRLISVDRWAYGRSDPHPAPALSSYAADLRELADLLRIERFALVALSGGAPFASAAAAGLRSRVALLALVSPMGPIDRDAGLRLFHQFCFRVLARSSAASLAFCSLCRLVLRFAPHRSIALAAGMTASVDKELIRSPQLRDHLAQTFCAGLRHNARGPAIDLVLFSQPWGVSLGDITARTRIWLGTADVNVPQVAAHQLAAAIPSAELTLLEGHGHLWVSHGYNEVLRWLSHCTD